jgi:hypothetical protein
MEEEMLLVVVAVAVAVAVIVFLRSVLRLLVTANVIPSSLILFQLMMDAIC